MEGNEIEKAARSLEPKKPVNLGGTTAFDLVSNAIAEAKDSSRTHAELRKINARLNVELTRTNAQLDEMVTKYNELSKKYADLYTKHYGK